MIKYIIVATVFLIVVYFAVSSQKMFNEENKSKQKEKS